MSTFNPETLARQRRLIDACLKHQVAFRWDDPGTFLISAKGLDAVLDEVMRDGYQVLGLDGFELESTIIHPRFDLIYSPRPDEDPRAVLKDWPSDIWIDAQIRRK